MLTLSGRLVVPGGAAAPSLEDIARSLARMPRFAGNTTRWWTVLHHSLVVDFLTKQAGQGFLSPAELAEARLYSLLHDAHEAVTGDVPTPWKTESLRGYQHLLDERIFREQGLRPPFELCDDAQRYLRVVDHLALWAEGLELGPPGLADLLPGHQRPPVASLAMGTETVKYIAMLYPEEDTRPLLEARFLELVRAQQALRHPIKG